MAPFKNNSHYERVAVDRIGCGIRNVHFMGTAEDWESLLKKVKKLEEMELGKSGEFLAYIKRMEVIISNLIATYNGTVNKEWWNKVFNLIEEPNSG